MLKHLKDEYLVAFLASLNVFYNNDQVNDDEKLPIVLSKQPEVTLFN